MRHALRVGDRCPDGLLRSPARLGQRVVTGVKVLALLVRVSSRSRSEARQTNLELVLEQVAPVRQLAVQSEHLLLLL